MRLATDKSISAPTGLNYAASIDTLHNSFRLVVFAIQISLVVPFMCFGAPNALLSLKILSAK